MCEVHHAVLVAAGDLLAARVQALPGRSFTCRSSMRVC